MGTDEGSKSGDSIQEGSQEGSASGAPDLKAIESAFAQAITLPEAEQQRFIEELRSQDLSIAQQVEALLAADEQDDAALLRPVHDSVQALSDLHDDRWLGQQIGVFEITRRIASGGMGAVFLAHRIDDTYQQQVAIKVMSAHLLNSDAIPRFRSERQILANLRHPNIAQLIDGGTTPDGLPYLVMEYIDGEPIDQYVLSNQLDIRARLSLFADVCAAVDYAHRNLVVHRDLKPSNILVGSNGEIKLLDFGIAKLLREDLDTGQTQVGARAMTLDYASPEQVRGDAISVGSDVYALGVLLYHLLTGISPYASSRGSAHELEHSILEEQPRRPSVAVSDTQLTDADSGSVMRSVLGAHLDPSRVSRTLSGDLDNIVLMAIRKDVEERYPSVRAFQDDIIRFLDDRPVQARPASWIYRARKFVSRNTASVGLATGSVVLLVGLTVVFTVRLAQERDVAEHERLVAQQVSEFVTDVFRTADPLQSSGPELTVREALDQGVEDIDEQLANAPEIKARVMAVLGKVYYGLGAFEQSVELARASLSLRSVATSDADLLDQLSTREVLGDSLTYLTLHDEALEAYTEVYTKRLELLGPEHAATVNVVANLGDLYGRMGQPEKQIEVCQASLEAARALTEVAEKTWLMTCLAGGLGEVSRTEEALALYAELTEIQRLAWGENDPKYLESLNNMAVAYPGTRASEAIELLNKVLTAQRKVLNENNPEFAITLANLGIFYSSNHQLDEAADSFAEALEVIEAGPDSRSDMYEWIIINAASVKEAQLQFAEAISLAEQAIATITPYPDGANANLAKAYSVIGRAARLLGDFERSLEYHDLSIAEYLKGYEPWHHLVLGQSLAKLNTYISAGRYADAVGVGEAVVGQADLSNRKSMVAEAGILTARAMVHAERPADAVQLLTQVHDQVREVFGEENWPYGVYLSVIADAQHASNDLATALQTRERAIDLLVPNFGPNHPRVGQERFGLAKTLLALGRVEEAKAQGLMALEYLEAGLGRENVATVKVRDWLRDNRLAPSS